jgi:hypothetical protein
MASLSILAPIDDDTSLSSNPNIRVYIHLSVVTLRLRLFWTIFQTEKKEELIESSPFTQSGVLEDYTYTQAQVVSINSHAECICI